MSAGDSCRPRERPSTSLLRSSVSGRNSDPRGLQARVRRMSGHAAIHVPNRRDGRMRAQRFGAVGPVERKVRRDRPARRRSSCGRGYRGAIDGDWQEDRPTNWPRWCPGATPMSQIMGSIREFSTIRPTLSDPRCRSQWVRRTGALPDVTVSPTGARWAPPAEAASRPPPAPARTEPEARLDARLLIFRHTVRFFSDVGLPRADGSPRLRKSEPSARTADVRSAVVAR
jgi:hypothetical protein